MQAGQLLFFFFKQKTAYEIYQCDWSSDVCSSDLDRLRARLSPSGNDGEATFRIETRREFLPDTLDILRQVLREATLPQDQFDIIQNKRVTDLEQTLTDPTSLARTFVSRQLNPYEPHDPRDRKSVV